MIPETEQPLRELARDEPLAIRARLMTDAPSATAPNGIKLVRVVAVDSAADVARIEIHFFNLNYLADVVARYTADPTQAKRMLPISGGSRIRAGGALGQVQVESSAAPATPAIAMPDAASPVLVARVTPIGDYSTYVLGMAAPAASGWIFDPLFSEISFKFRPGCFNSNCAPGWESAPRPAPEPTIDYLAKDYVSFRRTMITAMMARVPEWEATSEADLDMVLAELFSVAADELSDYQDRVMNEAYLASVRKRVSLARHARLMDYHIHQGNQASALLALEIEHDVGNKRFLLRPGLTAWAGERAASPQEVDHAVVFVSRHETEGATDHEIERTLTVHQYLNNIGLYTWSNTITTLAAGSLRADFKLYAKLYLDDASATVAETSEAAAREVQDLIRNGNIRQLLIQEHLNPETGLLPGRDPAKRQLLNLLTGNDPATAAKALEDPVTGEWFVRVRWEKADALQRDYCFRVECPAGNSGTAVGAVENVSLFHGNLVPVFHGCVRTTIFKDPEAQVSNSPGTPLQLHYERTRWGATCRLPEANLSYRDTPVGGDVPPVSTLALTVQASAAAPTDRWDEVASFIHSDDSAEQGDHFVVETDENRRSVIRFGNGRNGMELPDGAVVTATYQTGEPLEGNVGADTIINFESTTVSVAPAVPGLVIRSCWNPFDVTTARDREPVAEIIRRVPEAYRQHQLRAVTLADYVARAEEIKGVSRASARYAWTGSWRTVRITIDPAGTTELSDKLLGEVEAYLNAVRLIGEDIEVRPPRFVPLEIEVKACVKPELWPQDVQFALEQEFSDGWTSDGRMGFFHPELWTFGQTLHASEIIGRMLQVDGIEHVVAQRRGSGAPISVSMKRANSSEAPVESFTRVDSNEIILVLNDPDHMERGTITFQLEGGRQ